MAYLQTVAHHNTSWAWCRVTSLIHPSSLPLGQNVTRWWSAQYCILYVHMYVCILMYNTRNNNSMAPSHSLVTVELVAGLSRLSLRVVWELSCREFRCEIQVVHCMVHSLESLGQGVVCFLLNCHLIPLPSCIDVLLDSHTFVTCHKMDMTYIYCDNWFVAMYCSHVVRYCGQRSSLL